MMDAEFKMEGRKSAADQVGLVSALNGVAGIESASFFGDRLTVRYDPEEITRAEICEQIRRAGFQIASAENAPTTPLIEDVDS
jgi:hypothetical protein